MSNVLSVPANSYIPVTVQTICANLLRDIQDRTRIVQYIFLPHKTADICRHN